MKTQTAYNCSFDNYDNIAYKYVFIDMPDTDDEYTFKMWVGGRGVFRIILEVIHFPAGDTWEVKLKSNSCLCLSLIWTMPVSLMVSTGLTNVLVCYNNV